MRKFTKSSIALLLTFVLIISSCLPICAVEAKATTAEPTKYSSQYNSGQRDVVCTTLNGTSALTYYTGNNTYDKFDDMSQTELLSALRALMTSTHSYKSTYNDCHYLAHRTDCENEEGEGNTDAEKNVLLLYTSYPASQANWNGWDREHVWPQSKGIKEDNPKGGGADLHHVRPSDAGVNSSRGNKSYGESGTDPTPKTGTNPAVGYLGGTYNDTYFEPNDNVKGDIARIVLYVWVRWGNDWGAEDYDSNDKFKSVLDVFQSVDLLLEWCEADPVDTWEMGRNEVVQDIQGNRNVFIDYPELAWIIFNRDIPNDMTTPSGEAKNQKPDDGNSGGSTGGNTSCAHTNTGTINQADATCGAEGNTGDTYCYDCQKIIDSGSPIPATGKHSFGNWELDTENGVKTRECIVCEFKESVDINAAECSHGMSETRNKQAATCGKSGYSGDKCCVLCGYVIQTGRVLPATGNHSYGEAVVIREPTNVKNGLAEKTCADCHTKSVIVINALCSNEDLTKEILIDGIEDNPTKILLLMALGVSDKALLEELYK